MRQKSTLRKPSVCSSFHPCSLRSEKSSRFFRGSLTGEGELNTDYVQYYSNEKLLKDDSILLYYEKYEHAIINSNYHPDIISLTFYYYVFY